MRLIYSQLPLPLGTLPRSTALRSVSPGGRRRVGHGEVRTAITLSEEARGRARLWSNRYGKVNQAALRNWVKIAKLPLSGTRDTSPAMNDRKPPFRRPGGKPF